MIAGKAGSRRYERILRLLDQERKVILNGPLSALQALVDRREAAVTEILAGGTELPEAFLVTLKARAERNSRLILASLAGVKAAAARIEQIREDGGTLRTYTAEGTSLKLSRAGATRDRRA